MTKNCGPLNILDIFWTASLSLMILEKNLAVEKKKPFALEMASCSQSFFLAQKTKFCEVRTGP